MVVVAFDFDGTLVDSLWRMGFLDTVRTGGGVVYKAVLDPSRTVVVAEKIVYEDDDYPKRRIVVSRLAMDNGGEYILIAEERFRSYTRWETTSVFLLRPDTADKLVDTVAELKIK